jgi:stress response protein YsnF
LEQTTVAIKELMLYIRNEKEAKKSLTEEQHPAFIKKCEVYIGKLKSENKLIAAQPVVREAVVIKKSGNDQTEKNIVSGSAIQVGYYHILANDIEEAINAE